MDSYAFTHKSLVWMSQLTILTLSVDLYQPFFLHIQIMFNYPVVQQSQQKSRRLHHEFSPTFVLETIREKRNQFRCTVFPVYVPTIIRPNSWLNFEPVFSCTRCVLVENRRNCRIKVTHRFPLIHRFQLMIHRVQLILMVWNARGQLCHIRSSKVTYLYYVQTIEFIKNAKQPFHPKIYVYRLEQGP